jgi:hypothetical protein
MHPLGTLDSESEIDVNVLVLAHNDSPYRPESIYQHEKTDQPERH